MNAPATFDLAPRIAAYGSTVDTFMPQCGPEERRLRCGILYCRDKALASIRHARWEAALVLETVHRIAIANAFTAMPLDQLREVRAALVRLMTVAMAVEARGPGSAPDDAA